METDEDDRVKDKEKKAKKIKEKDIFRKIWVRVGQCGTETLLNSIRNTVKSIIAWLKMGKSSWQSRSLLYKLERFAESSRDGMEDLSQLFSGWELKAKLSCDYIDCELLRETCASQNPGGGHDSNGSDWRFTSQE